MPVWPSSSRMHNSKGTVSSMRMMHSDVRSTVCGDNLLWKVESLIRQVNGDVFRGWEVLHQEGMNGKQNGIMYGIVPPLLQNTGAGIKNMEQGLALATDFAE